MTTKICNICHESKTLDQFSKDKSKPDGHQRRCRACDGAKNTTYHAEHRDQKAAYHQTPKGKFVSYRSGAKERGLTFDLTMDEFMSFWQADCNYCGKSISTIGIDRIKSDLGYTLANCVSCCSMCNYIKLDHDNEVLNDHMLTMLRHQGIV